MELRNLNMIILLLILLFIIIDANQNYCPVSSIINTKVSGILSYPMDLFDVKQYHDIISRNETNELNQLYNCTSSERGKVLRKCSELTRCPILSENVHSAMNKSLEWKHKHSLCQIHQNLHNTYSVTNVYVFGGSVTTGTHAGGCCCTSKLDVKCLSFKNSCDRSCRWSRYFIQWLASQSIGKINLINFAVGGTTTPYISRNMFDLFQQRGVNQLNGSDLIILDYSVNDGMTFGSKKGKKVLVEGLDLFMKVIHDMTQDIHHAYPTVIVLAMWPFIDGTTYASHHADANDISEEEYYRTYIEFCRKYHLLLWSYRDTVWSNFSTNSSNMKSFVSHLQFLHNKDGVGPQHPPFYIHLYYADLIGSLMVHEFEKCFFDQQYSIKHSHKKQSLVINDDYDDSKILFKSQENTSTLDIQSRHCKSHSTPLLLQSANIESKHADIGNYFSEKWNFTEDRPHKFGWIDEELDLYCSSNDETVLVFESSRNISKENSYLLKIDYLQTYYNAGIAEVFICNQYITTLDALWPNFDDYHFSLTSTFVTEFNLKSLNLNCKDNIPTIKIWRKSCFEYKFKNETDSSHLNILNARFKFKFKLTKIMICEV